MDNDRLEREMAFDRLKANGNSIPVELPPAREAVIEQAQRVYQEVAHERDQLLRKVGELQSDIAGYKVAVEAQASQLAAMESRVAEMTLVRDQAVMQWAEVRTVLNSIMVIGQPYLNRDVEVKQAEPGRTDNEWEAKLEARATAQEARQDAVNRAGPRVAGL
jgi:hypothetical protein